jgi:hypothetical protein
MITSETKATTGEICRLAGISKQHLGRLEREGVVQQTARDQWPLVETINKLFNHARTRNEAALAAKQRYEEARAQREETRARQAAGELCNRTNFEAAYAELSGRLFSRIDGLPAAYTRDLNERRRLQDHINRLRNEFAAELKAEMERGAAA